MKIYCEKSYKAFKDLMKSTIDLVYRDSEEKKGFTKKDAVALVMFSVAVDNLCNNLMESINKESEEDE